MVGASSRAGASSPLVGRQDELASLVRAVLRPPAVVLIEGEAGVGKSRLVHELLGRTELAGVRRLLGYCHPLREPFPFGPVVEALARAGTGRPPGALPTITGALRELLPELAHWLPPVLPDAGDPRTERHQRFRAVRELLAAFGPTVLVLEDVHWVDDGTLELVRYLGHDPPAGLCLILTARPEDRHLGSSAGRHQELRLDRLSVTDVRRLAAAWLGVDDVGAGFVERLHGRTGGLPLAVEELLRLLPTTPRTAPTAADIDGLGVPATLRSFLTERLDRLPPTGRRVVEAAAALGVPADERTLTAVAGLPPGAASRGLTEALRYGVLLPVDATRYGFHHSLAMDAAYDAVARPRLHRLHGRAERVLRDERPPPHARLARHARLAGRPVPARRHAERAADEAVRLGDNVTATSLLRTVLETPSLPRATRVRLTVKLARAATLGLAHTEVVPLLRHVLATESLPAGSRGEIRLNLGLMLCNQAGDTDAGIEQLGRAATELRARPDLAVRALSALAVPDHTPGPVDENLRALRAAMRLLPRVSDPVARTAVLVNRASTLLCIGDPTAWSAIGRLPTTGRSPAEDQQLHRGLCNVVNNCLTLGHYGRATRFLARAEPCGSTSTEYPGSLLTQLRIHLDFATGRWSTARRQVLEQARSVLPAVRQDASMLLGVFALLDGDPAEARRRILAACPDATSGWRLRTDAMTMGWLVTVLLELGQPAAALARVQPLLAAVRVKGAWVWAAELAPPVVDALLATGRPEEARALVTEFAAGVHGRDAPLSAAAVARCQATLAAATGEDRQVAAEGHLTARSLYAALPRPYDAALAAAAAGHCLGPDGSPHLEQALAEFDNLGARAAAATCRSHLRVMGAVVPNRRGRPAYGRTLSPREQQVLDLVTSGHTNREIAAALYLSERTVEGHVAHLLHKLGLRTRRDLWTTPTTDRGHSP